MKLCLTYDDIALVPKYNNIASRKDPTLSLRTKLTRTTTIDIPILAANMDSVIGIELARVLTINGSIPIFHRFTSRSTKEDWIQKFPSCFFSCGVKSGDIEEIKYFYKNYGLKGVVLDIAHGHSDKMLKAIDSLKATCHHIEVIAGNVCTPQAVHDLFRSGVDGVKIGIGPSPVCRTREVTAFGIPQFTAVQECAKEANKYGIPAIADGGIRNSRDIILALAAGASTVMIGKLFAQTMESAAEKKTYNGIQEAKYRGQASEDFQLDFYHNVKNTPEGEVLWVQIKESANQLLDHLLGGIRSGFTYGGARSIEELQQKAEFVRVTPSYKRTI